MREGHALLGVAAAPRLLDRPRASAVAIGLPVAEAVLLLVLAPASAAALAPHVTAPEPFALFHDLRWLLVYHPNALAFGAEALLLVAFRSTVTAVLVHDFWPANSDSPAPSWARLLGRSAAFTVGVGALFSLWAALAFGMAVISLSWLFFVAVPLALVMAVLLHPAAIGRGWWRTAPPPRTVGWIVVTFAVLTVAGAVTAASPAPLRVPIAAAAGIFNAAAWRGIVRGIVRGVVHRSVREQRTLPLAPVGALAMVAVAAVGTTVGFHLARPTSHPFDRARATSGGQPVLVVTGFGGGWSGTPQQRFGTGFAEHRFSYRGLGDDGTPLAYATGDTLRALPELVTLMGHQVERFHAATGRRISIVAESEGALLAKAYLAAQPNAPVDRLVMLSPLLRPGRAYYPPGGADGWGRAASWELAGLSLVIRGLTPLAVDTDTALLRSVADHGHTLRSLMPCALPGVEELQIVPLADAFSTADFDDDAVRTIAVPDFHGGLLSDGRARRLVAAELRGERPEGWDGWSYGTRLLRALGAGWQVPELHASLNPAWDGQGGDCDDVRDDLAGWALAPATRGR